MGNMRFRVLLLLFFVQSPLALAQHGVGELSEILNPGKLNWVPLDTPDSLNDLRQQDSTRSVSELRRRFYNIEQICFFGNDETTRESTKRVDVRMQDLEKALKERCEQLKVSIVDAPENFLKGRETLDNWQGRELFLDRFRSRNIEDRCRMVELLLTEAVARVSTIPPSKPICGFNDFACEDSSDELFQKDLRRLNWEFRYLKAIDDADLSEGPEACRGMLREARERVAFAQPQPGEVSRWPLGRAFGMCARPMNAHYLDDDVVNDKKEEPKGWGAALDHRNLPWEEVFKIESFGVVPN